MAEPLTVSKSFSNIGTNTMRIEGFTEQELSELNSMDYREMKEKVLEILDSRNHNTVTCWKCGYGVYHMWIRDHAVYAEIGNTCD